MHNNNRLTKQIIILFLIVALAGGCGAPTINPTATSAPPTASPTTHIAIDGNEDDWAGYNVIGSDPAGDQVAGSPDLAEVKAFNNDQFFYLLIHLHETGTTDHYDILMDTNGGPFDFQVSVWPDKNQANFATFPVTGMKPMDGVTSAQGQVIEVKIPLSAIKDSPVRSFLVQTYLGNAVGDMMENLNPMRVSEIEPASVPVTSGPTIQSTSLPTSSPCKGEVSPGLSGFTLVEPGLKTDLLWKVEFVPWWVRSSPDGRILAVTDGGDSIFELKLDGSLSVIFRCPGVVIETAVAASDGAIWFATRDGGRLYRVTPDGNVSILAQSGNRNLEAGLNGSVFAMENGLVRIDPDGTKKNITNDVSGRKFAIGPKGEIVALKNGSIVRISDSGEISQIASGYGPEQWLTFGPDGLLYVTHWTGVDVIDLETRAVSSIPWLKDSNIGESGTFAPDGRLLLYHPNTNVFAIDLSTHTISVLQQVLSNSWAMATNPGDTVYIAFGNKQPNGQTTIYRVIDQQTLEPVGSVPYGIERSMTFDSHDTGYLGVGDEKMGGNIFKFDPASGKIAEYFRPRCFPGSLTVDHQTDQVWWEDCNRFVSLDKNGNPVGIDGVPAGQQASLAITPAGEFFTTTFFKRESQNQPFEHRLYRWNKPGSTWDEVADLTQSDPAITLSTLVACPDGRIYTVESLDGNNLHQNHSSFNAVRRLEPNGTLTLLGYDFSFDGLAANCDPATGRIVFTSGAGIFALTPP